MSDARPPIAPGLELSGYLVSEQLGAGGFAQVHLATPVDGGPPVALKVAVRPELVSALRSEEALLRRLQGPRFVRVLEEHTDADPPHFVLECCPGGDLRRALAAAPEGRLEPAEVERLLRGVLEGMAFAHDEGVVHGDLKPENVLLDADGEPKIADLGLSRAQRRRLLLEEEELAASLATAEPGRVRGTFDYIAPEVRAGAPLAPGSDVYALGVLTYELLVGRRPLGLFELPGPTLAKARARGEAAPGPPVPAPLDRVVSRALARDPLVRYPDAATMLADLEAGEEGLDVSAASLEARTSSSRALGLRPMSDGLQALLLLGSIVGWVAWTAPAWIVVHSEAFREASAGARLLVRALLLGAPLLVASGLAARWRARLAREAS